VKPDQRSIHSFPPFIPSLMNVGKTMERPGFLEPLRRTQSANPTRSPHDPPFVRKSSPVAPTLMLINGSGEASSLPSPIGGAVSDDRSFPSDAETPVLEHYGDDSKSLSVPGLLGSPSKSRTRDYSPSISRTNPPLSLPKRNLSPPKMVIATDSKPRPVLSLLSVLLM
jgi:hypothetical protein